MIHPFGLDISDSLIRLAMIERTRAGWRLAVRGEIAVPKGWIEDGEIRKPDDLNLLIGQLLKAAGPKIKQAVVSLPERHTFLKLITLSDASQNSLAESVKIAASQHLPFAWEEMYCDWAVLPEKNSLRQTQVMVAAAPRSLVDTYISVLSGLNIEPVSYEIESLAIARATLTKEQLRGTYIILDLGRTRSTLMLVQKGIVKFSTTVRYAGNALDEHIAKELNISPTQASKAKTLFGLDPIRGKGILRQVLAPAIDQLAKKVAEAEDFYREHGEEHQPINGILLTGSGALLREIDQELAARLQHSVAAQPAWIVEELGRTDPGIAPDLGFTYANVLGLALQSFVA